MKTTALYELHKKFSGKMVTFAGYEMPLQYSSLLKEHAAVREAVGIFDVSHMGELLIRGKQAISAVNKLISNRLKEASLGLGVYSPMLYEHGGCVDDIIAFPLADDEVLLVVNAANEEKDFNWVKTFLAKNFGDTDLRVSNESDKYALLALQGKHADELLGQLLPEYRPGPPFSFGHVMFAGANIFVSRTGYTGEAGIEALIDISGDEGKERANLFFKQAIKMGALPCGLGARNTLRLEKGYMLYGQDISEKITPLEAGLRWTVKFKKQENFIGKEALLKQLETGLQRKLFGLRLQGKVPAREGALLYKHDAAQSEDESESIGMVSSGSWSPSLKAPIAMAFLNTEFLASEEAGKEAIKVYAKLHNKFVAAEIGPSSFL